LEYWIKRSWAVFPAKDVAVDKKDFAALLTAFFKGGPEEGYKEWMGPVWS